MLFSVPQCSLAYKNFMCPLGTKGLQTSEAVSIQSEPLWFQDSLDAVKNNLRQYHPSPKCYNNILDNSPQLMG